MKSVGKNLVLCFKRAQCDARKLSQYQAKSGAGASAIVKQEKMEKPKREKEEKPKKQEPEEELDVADKALFAEPPSTGSYDQLHRGTFNFDNEDEAISIPNFWEKIEYK